MSELKPCPFCGEIPIVEVIARFPRSGKDEGKRIKGYTVVCQNKDCILHNADNWYQRSGKKACEAWNHRAEPEMRPLTLEEVLELGKDEDSIVYIESRRFGGRGWCQPCAIIFDSSVEGRRNEIHFYEPGNDLPEFCPEAEYGKSWRCWPRKPTPEQMAAEKWEE